MIDLSDYLASWREYYGSGSGWATILATILLVGFILFVGVKACMLGRENDDSVPSTKVRKRHGRMSAALAVWALPLICLFIYAIGEAKAGPSVAEPDSLTKVLSDRYGLKESSLSCRDRRQWDIALEVGRNGLIGGTHSCTAQTKTSGKWVKWDLVISGSKVGFFDMDGNAVEPVKTAAKH